MLVTAVAFAAALACGAAWAALGRAVWWVPAFAFSFMGGYLDVGFKIYPHEIGFALSLVTLAAHVVFDTRRRTGRPPLDWSVAVLIVYMAAHMAVSCGISLADAMPGTGTIVRVYMNGLWAAIFVALFWAYGRTHHLNMALILATSFCVVRVAMAAFRLGVPERVAAESGALFVAPVGVDLRVSAVLLVALLVIGFYRSPRSWMRIVIGLAVGAAVYLAWIGGSRVAALTAVLILLFWAAVQRRRTGLVAGAAGILAVVAVIAAVNASEGFYDRLPDGARRSLSAFLVTRNAAVHEDTEVSNAWHAMLLEAGLRRWTRGPTAFLVGSPVEGWDPGYATAVALEDRAEIAIKLSSYESGMITVAATVGIVGLLLWGRTLYWLHRPFAGRILRRGIRDPHDALAFVAVQSLFLYLGFSWIAGGYPAVQCVWGVLAAASFVDRRKAEAS